MSLSIQKCQRTLEECPYSFCLKNNQCWSDFMEATGQVGKKDEIADEVNPVVSSEIKQKIRARQQEKEESNERVRVAVSSCLAAISELNDYEEEERVIGCLYGIWPVYD